MPKHLIKNFDALAKTPARRDALKILEAGLIAVRTDLAIRTKIKIKKNILFAGSRKYNLSKFKNIYVIGFGKAAHAAAGELEKILGSRLTGGIVLSVAGGKLKKIKTLIGTHPLPSEQNISATGEIVEIIKKAESKDLVIAIVSGGGSALLCRPSGVKCDELAFITETLMRSGAEIREENVVRKHLSEILGGQFARLAYPATVLGLIFSDVPGDDISVVASGPTVMDTTTIKDAARVLAKYDIIKTCSLPTCNLTETPKDPIFFKHVHNVLVVANSLALETMKKEAKRLGYKVRLLSSSLEGEARSVGGRLATMPDNGEAVIAGGETTVTVAGHGKGGRNQELALGSLNHIIDGTVVVSCASDGQDNSPAAGAIGDLKTKQAAERLKLDVGAYLANNDSFPFMKMTKSQILTGVTEINISDLMIALRK